MLSGNVGEWSEIYVLLSLLGHGHITLANSDLSPNEDSHLSVVEVHRNGPSGQLRFEIDEQDRESIRLVGFDEIISTRSEILENARELFRTIVKGGSSIQLPQLENLLARMRTHQLAAPSTGKSDLSVLVRDGRTGGLLTMSFSIKSQVGGASTLLNASGATNFTYSIVGKDRDIQFLESLGREPQKIISHARNLGVLIRHGRPTNHVFDSNLRMVDSGMAAIVSTMLLCHFSGDGSLVADVAEHLEAIDPLGIGQQDASIFYPHKIKDLLVDLSLGMTPSKKWDGSYIVNAGYLMVAKEGRVVCLLFEQRDVLRDYLFLNTKFERGSRSRHKYGGIRKDASGAAFLDLNLQIRFIK
jgi:hypothetical protein